MYKIIFLFFLFFFFSVDVHPMEIKEADLAGNWYPSDAQILYKQINNYLNEERLPPLEGEVIAIISPHAGIVYSGKVAAAGFKAVQGRTIDTVIVVGFSHSKYYDGIAVFDKDGIRTPLGVLYVDKDLVKKMISYHKKIFPYMPAFQRENSIELILPFIQVALGNPKVVLLAIGGQSWENCNILGEALYRLLKDKDNFLIVASTDMSHYLPWAEAREVDASTAKLITQMNPQRLFFESYGKNRMCGLAAVVSTMIGAKKLGANRVYVLGKGSSSQANGNKERVVGYLSAALVKQNKKKLKEQEVMGKLLNDQQKEKLLKLARDTLTLYLTKGEILPVKEDDPLLNKHLGVFVTLRKGHQLRGCIGTLVGREPLYLGVRDMAIASATEDPRFLPLTKEELDDIKIEISVLSPLKKIDDPDQIILGTHGVLVKDAFRSGVYLPQVATETGWTKEEFLNSLCRDKAGMPADAWKTGKCQMYIFTAEVFSEE